MIIAIDGPAASGKSTIAKLISKKLEFEYLDTGALYRGVTYLIYKNDLSLNNEDMVVDLIKKTEFSFNNNHLFINGNNVETEIRKNNISKLVSAVASTQYIRTILTEIERKIGHQAKNIIMDGRDIGTVVFPDAEVKIFLTASTRVRALRRYNELLKKNEIYTIEEIERDIIKRDEIDSKRATAPLVKSDDAIEVNTDNLNIEGVVEVILSIINKKIV